MRHSATDMLLDRLEDAPFDDRERLELLLSTEQLDDASLVALADLIASYTQACQADTRATQAALVHLFHKRTKQQAIFARARADIRKAIERFLRRVDAVAKRQLATRKRIDRRRSDARIALLRSSIARS